jgi:fructose/tagatose bisphosphate aldolase
VAKVNVNTELRAAYFATLRDGVERHRDALDLKRLTDDVRAAVGAVVEAKLDLLGWAA